MSQELNITEIIEEIGNVADKLFYDSVFKFIHNVEETYNIPSCDLIELYNKSTQSSSGKSTRKLKIKPRSTPSSSTDAGSSSLKDVDNDEPYEDIEILMLANREELSAYCKKHNLKCSGTKAKLFNRLIKKPEDTPVPKAETAKASKASKAPKGISATKAKITSYLQSQSNDIVLEMSKHGNVWHPESKLVFDQDNERVIGKERDDGQIAPLTPEDIDTCNRYKFDFDIPENLDHNKPVNEEVKEDEIEEEEDDSDNITIDDEDDEEVAEIEVLVDSDDEYEEVYVDEDGNEVEVDDDGAD